MSDLSKFALEVASLLDKIANSAPDTSTVPGAPFHLSVLAMGKAAKSRHEKRAYLPGTILGALGGLGAGAAGLASGALPLAGMAAGGAGLGALGTKLWRSAQPALESYFSGAGKARAAQIGKKSVQEGVEAMGPKAFAEQGLAQLQLSNPAQFEEAVRGMPNIEAFFGGEMAKELAAQQAKHQAQLQNIGVGGALGLGGLYAGSRMGQPRQSNNLPQIVRYG